MPRRMLFVSAAFAAMIGMSASSAAESLVVSSWGGSWRDMIAETIAKKFTETTGVEVEFITGGTIDRLNQAQLAAGDPESDITFTTSHVGMLYMSDNLFEPLDMDRIPNAANMFKEGRISDGHIGVWSYVYTIGYRPDLVPEGITFESWEDLWNPALAETIGLPDFDPSHIIVVSALLSGGDAANWEVGHDKLLELKPNIKAFYSSDAVSQQFMSSGETPVQVILSMNAYHQISEGVPIELVIPSEGAIIGIDTVSIMRGSDKIDLAYEFINAAFDPEVQAELAAIKRGGPMIPDAPLDPEVANLPGVLTTIEEWDEHAIVIDHQLRAEKLSEWRTWFSENMIAR
jgi:putative spermidine/putrescine transport system substrate-binding protein